MLHLYRLSEAKYTLSGDDYPYILAPDIALRLAIAEYDFNPQRYHNYGCFDVPKRQSDIGMFPKNTSGNHDEIYRMVKSSLNLGDLIGIDRDISRNSAYYPFYIVNNDEENTKELMCKNSGRFSSIYVMQIMRSYKLTQASHTGFRFGAVSKSSNTLSTLNSKSVGRLLAAGGVYNGNIEGFKETAEKLGGDAAEGFDQVVNEKTSGMWMAGVSLIGLNRMRSMSNISELKDFLGKYKGQQSILKNINVQELNYLRRDRQTLALLRREFDVKVKPQFLKEISTHPDVIKTFSEQDIARLASGKGVMGWSVHHKVPLDDSGDNALSNLVLIQETPYHKTLTNAQRAITKDILPGQAKNILWPTPPGVIYPKP